jgi:uncharacterized protein (DUF302 family)
MAVRSGSFQAFIKGGTMGVSATKKMTYGYRRSVDLPFEAALERTRNALKDEGFGVLTEIDLKEKFKEKLGKDFRNYVIFGACKPDFAYRALADDLDIGLLLPCNVVLYDGETGTEIAVIDAEKALSITGRSNLETMSVEVSEKLRRALAAI